MNRTPSDTYSNNFYTWEKQFRGHAIAPAPVSVQPRFEYFKRVNHAKDLKRDDSIVPTHLESLVSFFKKQYQQIRKQKALPESIGNDKAVKEPAGIVTFGIYVPQECIIIKHNEFEQFLMMLSVQAGTIAFEIVATAEKICLYVACAASHADTIAALAQSYLPALIIIQKIPDPILSFSNREYEISICELGLHSEFTRPLQFIEHSTVDPFISVFAALENLAGDEMAAVQLLFHHSDRPWKESIKHALYNELGQPFFYQSPEMISSAEQKCLHPMFGAIVRIAVQAKEHSRVQVIQKNIGAALIQSTASPVNHLVVLSNDGYNEALHYEDFIQRTTHRMPFVLNSHELLLFAHLPGAAVVSKKYRSAFTRTKAVPEQFLGHQFMLGYNTHGGLKQKITIGSHERIRHTYIAGGSGMGKSTVLGSMIKEDMRLGNGICVIDPHGLLIDTVLQHVPSQRRNDVIILDPADDAYCFSLNILSAKTEAEKGLLASEVTSIFKRHAISWGDSLDSIFNNAIAAFLYNTSIGTLADVRRFLIDALFRSEILKTVTDPHIVFYWEHEFPLLRSNSIAPILTRLDTFLRPKALRNMLCQQKGFDFETLLNTRKILFVKLPIGIIGEENAYLLGELLITKLYQAAVARQANGILHDFYIYVDECHHFIRSATSITNILSGARKYHFSITMANQSLSQIKEPAIIDSLLTNVATRICFRFGESDAKRFAEGFSSFSPYDLQNLKVGEAICRIDRPEQDFSLEVPPPDEPVCDQDAIAQMIERSRIKYCVPRIVVEEQLLASLINSHTSNKHKKSRKEEQELR